MQYVEMFYMYPSTGDKAQWGRHILPYFDNTAHRNNKSVLTCCIGTFTRRFFADKNHGGSGGKLLGPYGQP